MNCFATFDVVMVFEKDGGKIELIPFKITVCEWLKCRNLLQAINDSIIGRFSLVLFLVRVLFVTRY